MHYLSIHSEANGSAKSLGQVLSYLKVAYESAGVSWLNAMDARLTAQFLASMKEMDYAAVRQSVPITTRVLHRWFRHLPTDDPHEALLTAMLLTGQCGLLRAAENTRRENKKDKEAGYRVADLTWNADGSAFTMALGLTKGNRQFGGDHVTIANATTVKAMRRYLTMNALTDRPDALLYPEYATTRWLGDQIKRLATLSGDDPNHFTPHGLRAGGATDLVEGGVEYPVLKAAGRWKSDACLVYFRSEAVVSAVVAKAVDEAWLRAEDEAKASERQGNGYRQGRERPEVTGRLSGGEGVELKADGLARLLRGAQVTEVQRHPTDTHPTEKSAQPPLPVKLKPNKTSLGFPVPQPGLKR